tara:strand:- start:764 stop:1324 length:561 start_codon:yes stop_codon:yes gene_type:complete
MGQGILVWMDLEMTGLDPREDTILEVASIVTDTELNIIAQGPNLIVQCDEERLQKMDKWNTKHHKASGLWNACMKSEISLAKAEEITMEFLQKHVKKEGTTPLCGNSVWQDRRFLAEHMKKVDSFLHYRLVDVSTLKELYKYWLAEKPKFEKKNLHRALNDIEESIAELRFYKQEMFGSPSLKQNT